MNPAADVSSAQTGPDWVSLITRYQKGDSEATAHLIAFASPLLYRFLAGPLGSRSEAEDLLQEVWLKIHRARRTYRAGEPVLPWLYAIARHVRVDSYRKRRRIASHETVMEVLPEPLFRHGASTQARSVPAWETLLAELPDSQREVVTLLKVK